MSEATGNETTPETPAQETPAKDETQEPAKAETDWQAEARKWERRAKDNKSAADELAKVRENQMTEAEKAEARVKTAEERVRDLEAANARKDVAIEHRLDPDDAELLNDLTDVDAMRRLASRLQAAANDAAGPHSPRPDKNQGRSSSGPATTADQFAAALGGAFKR